MKQSEIERQKAKAAVAFKIKKSFIGRNLYLFYGVVLVYVLASLWSMATAAGNIYIRISEMLGENWFAMLCAGVAGFSIVGLQFISGKGMVDDLQIGILDNRQDGENLYPLADRLFFALKVVGFIAMTGVSITLSVNGVGKANEWFREVKNPPALAAADVAYYDQELARIDGLIAVEKTRKWKGVLTTEASRQIKRYEANAAKLRDQRQASIQKTDAANAGLLADYNEKTQNNTQALKGVGGVAEIIIIFCVLFIGLYDDGLYREASLKASPGLSSSPRSIGFPSPSPAFGQGTTTGPADMYRGTNIGFSIRGTGGTMSAQNTGGTTVNNVPRQVNVPLRKSVPPLPGEQKRRKYTDSERRELDTLKHKIKGYKRRNLGEQGAATLAAWIERKEQIQRGAKNRK
jgi:hypothetical protein